MNYFKLNYSNFLLLKFLNKYYLQKVFIYSKIVESTAQNLNVME
jgi:hypothetical protein